MAQAGIRLFPDPILRKKAKTVSKFGPSLKPILSALMDTLRAQPSGIGIAAPQIGISQRIVIVDVSARVPGAKLMILINPEIQKTWEQRPSREGCMSVPEYTGNLHRFNQVQIVWHDPEGRRNQKIAAGLEAVCIQHEIDHLNGVLFLDHVSSLKTDMIPRDLKSKRP